RIGRGPAGIRGIVGCADRIVYVVVPGTPDVAGGDGAVRVELGVAADHVHDRIAHAVQLAAIDRIGAGRTDLARGHVGDHHVPGVDAGDGHARPARDHQAGVTQVHVRADRNAGGVDEGVAGGDAAHIQVAVEGHLDHAVLVGSGLGDADVLVALEVHRAVGPDVHLVLARTAQVPARVGGLVDQIQLLFRRGPSAAVSQAGVIDGLVGQAADRAGVTADHDRVGPADRDDAAADGRGAGAVGHGDGAGPDRGTVASAVVHRGAVCGHGGDVTVIVLHRGAVRGHRGDVAIGIGHGQAIGVEHRVPGGHAVHGDVVSKVEGHVIAVGRLGDDDVAVVIVQVDRVAGGAVDAHVGGVFTLRADVPARVGHVVHLAQLILRRSLAADDVVRIEGEVGQATDGPGLTADHDRVGPADRDDAAADGRGAGAVGHGDGAGPDGGAVAGTVVNVQTIGVQRGIADRQAAVCAQVDVLVELHLQGVSAIGNHADVAVGQRGLVGRTTHQVHRFAQPALHVRTGIAGEGQRGVG